MSELDLWKLSSYDVLKMISNADDEEFMLIEMHIAKVSAAARTLIGLRTNRLSYSNGTFIDQIPSFSRIYNVAELREFMFEGMSAKSLSAFERTCRKHRLHAVDYQSRKMANLIGIFDADSEVFLPMLDDHQAIVIGGVAHLAFNAENEWFPVTNMDIVATKVDADHIANFLRNVMGYSDHIGLDGNFSTLHPVRYVYEMSKNIRGRTRIIKVTIVRGESQGSSVEALLNAPSTASFNAITGHGLFVGYPDLMDHKLAIRNDTDSVLMLGEGALTAPPRWEIIESHVVTYQSRGIQFIEDKHATHEPHECNKSPNCPSTVRTMTDKGSLFIRIHTTAERTKIVAGQYLRSLRLPSVSWRLADGHTGDEGHGRYYGGDIGEIADTIDDEDDGESTEQSIGEGEDDSNGDRAD